jgi:long-chain fatty acid transport protein
MLRAPDPEPPGARFRIHEEGHMIRKLSLLALAASLILASSALAGGFLLYEQNASGTGMCGARAAVADDPSSMFYNPAAITELPGVQLQFGVTGVLPFMRYEADNQQPARTYPDGTPINDGTNDVDAKIKGFNPIHLYATWNIFESGFHLGFGLTNAFGLGTYWPGDWDGRFVATETEIQTFLPNLVLAVDIAKLAGFKDSFKLSLAAGYTFIYGTARLSKHIDLSGTHFLNPSVPMDAEGEMRMTGSGTGHGWNVALYAEWPGLLGFGLSTRGGFNGDGSMGVPFEGTANFVFNDSGLLARDYLSTLGTVFPDKTTGNVTINLPLNFNMGVSFLGVKNLIVAADFYYADFSSYDKLAVSFACAAPDVGTCSDKLNKVVEKNWGASWQISLGLEYKLFDVWPLRIGYGTVSSPAKDATYDPSLPDGQRQLITVGTGYHWSWGKLDLGYMLAFWSGTKNNRVGEGEAPNYEGMANGKYTTYSHLLGLTFTAAL